MPVYLVTYDLNSPGQKHAKVLEKIKSFDRWARLSESSYAIVSSGSPKDIYEKNFMPLLDNNDTLYVIAMHMPYWGLGTKEINDWLSNNLTSC
jgi:hypothetical protein